MKLESFEIKNLVKKMTVAVAAEIFKLIKAFSTVALNNGVLCNGLWSVSV